MTDQRHPLTHLWQAISGGLLADLIRMRRLQLAVVRLLVDAKSRQQLKLVRCHTARKRQR